MSFCNEFEGLNPLSEDRFYCEGTKAELQKRIEERRKGPEGHANPDNKGFGFVTTIMSLKMEDSVDYMQNYRYLVVAEGENDSVVSLCVCLSLYVRVRMYSMRVMLLRV